MGIPRCLVEQRREDVNYRNLANINLIIPTIDTHTAMQIFHPIFWINKAGEHPTPAVTNISL